MFCALKVYEEYVLMEKVVIELTTWIWQSNPYLKVDIHMKPYSTDAWSDFHLYPKNDRDQTGSSCNTNKSEQDVKNPWNDMSQHRCQK